MTDAQWIKLLPHATLGAKAVMWNAEKFLLKSIGAKSHIVIINAWLSSLWMLSNPNLCSKQLIEKWCTKEIDLFSDLRKHLQIGCAKCSLSFKFIHSEFSSHAAPDDVFRHWPPSATTQFSHSVSEGNSCLHHVSYSFRHNMRENEMRRGGISCLETHCFQVCVPLLSLSPELICQPVLEVV